MFFHPYVFEEARAGLQRLPLLLCSLPKCLKTGSLLNLKLAASARQAGSQLGRLGVS